MRLVGLDFTSLATIQPDGSVCCRTCGSWTTLDDLMRDGQCGLCRDDMGGLGSEVPPRDVLRVYDNQGKTIDRFCVVLGRRGYGLEPGLHPCFCLSTDPDSPLGVSQSGSCRVGRHLGRRIRWEELPVEIRKHMEWRLDRRSHEGEEVEDPKGHRLQKVRVP
jgi:hypothetical protein